MPLPLKKSGASSDHEPLRNPRLDEQSFPSDPIIRPRSTDRRTNGSIFADGCRKEVISRFEKLLFRGADFENRARMALLWSGVTRNPAAEPEKRRSFATSNTESSMTGVQLNSGSSVRRSSTSVSLTRSFACSQSSLRGRPSSTLRTPG